MRSTSSNQILGVVHIEQTGSAAIGVSRLTTEYRNRRRHDIASAGARFPRAGALSACRHMIPAHYNRAAADCPVPSFFA
jgi:hypothetical protein